MSQVMVLDGNLDEAGSIERILSVAGYSISVLTEPFAVLPKFDYEKPSFVLIDPAMPGLDAEAFVRTISSASRDGGMAVIVLGHGDAQAVRTYCRKIGANGYYMADRARDGRLDGLVSCIERLMRDDPGEI